MISTIEPPSVLERQLSEAARRVFRREIIATVNAEHMRAWIHELRTTEIAQGTGNLRWASFNPPGNGPHFCCCAQGIACEVAINREEVPLKRASRGYRVPATEQESFYYALGVLPAVMYAWLGLPDYGTVYVLASNGEPVGVDALNDARKLTFAEIADALEITYLPHDAAARAENATKENEK